MDEGWNNAPFVARTAWVLAVAGSGLNLLCAALCWLLTFTEALPHDDATIAPVFTILFALACTISAATNVYLALHVLKPTPGAWDVQVIFSCLCLVFGFPVFTLLHGILLNQWFKPENKAWFGRA
jgi:peptidoglycan biosynthesis protein MviN/MurJ (putative lipid II flippase)